MCAENSAPPIASSGETSATTMAMSPAAKHQTRQGATPRPWPPRRQSARTPRA